MKFRTASQNLGTSKFLGTSRVLRTFAGFRSACARSASVALLAAMSIGLVVGGCVEDVGLIDRVQANHTKKADLAGVWYEMAIVTDMPSSASFGFVGLMNYGDKDGKIVFDVQEKFLVVYPTSETVLGSSAKWNKKKIRKYWDASLRSADHGKTVRDEDFIEIAVGNPTAIYPITSHFDIKRDYSTTTGAQTNVLVENSTDRPWWQREYIRVDWMGNSLMNVMFPQGSMKYSPVDYYVPQDEKDNPNRFYAAPEGGYFHFTRRMFGQPVSQAACNPYSLAPSDCAGAEFDTRVSYKRVNTKRLNDYEIMPYANAGAQDKFGFFLAERYSFDEDYGLNYTGHDYKAARWNIWKNSKVFSLPKDADGKTVDKVCLSNSDCAAPQVCDQDGFFVPGSCKVGARIDYTKRGIRPILYHLSVDQPADHLTAEYETADAWSDVFKETVSWLQFWEKKWSSDIAGDHVGFTDPQSKFGQRFCQSHGDCSQHSAAAVTVETHGQNANRIVIAAGSPGAKTQTIVVEDCFVGTDAATSKQICTDRPKLATGDTYVAFVNASPGVDKATLSGLPTSIADVAFKAGTIAAKDHAVVVPKGKGGTLTLTADVGGGKSVKLDNVVIGSDAVIVVLVGGDTLVALSTKGVKAGLRMINGVASIAGTPSAGEAFEVGLNGMRVPGNLEYGKATDYVYSTGNNPHATFNRIGSRGDVACTQAQGVGVCTGWRQTLTEADTKTRADIKASLQDVFVLCENQFTRTKASCDAAGETGKHTVKTDKGEREVLNDCRYWIQLDGKDFNPCADVTKGGFVQHADEMKIGGDSRYNFMYWVTNMEPTSPLGYGPAAADPDTGEIQWATANVYGASLITYSQYAKDLVDLLNGDLSVDDVATGKYIKDYVQKQSQTGKDKTEFLQGGGPSTPEETLAMAREQATVRMMDNAPAVGATRMNADDAKLASDMMNPANLKAWMGESQPTFDMKQVFAQLDKIKGTELERAMINDEVALVMSEGALQPGDEISPEMLGKISPTGWATPRKQMDENRRMQLLGINSIELAEFQDPAIFGLAQRMKCKPGQTPEAVWTEIHKNDPTKCFKGDALRTALSVALFAATIEHEVGHTVGLRHNFEGSMDLMNYFEGYFDEATGREKELVACSALTTPAGSISADDFCEKETFGEKCVYSACKINADCTGGSACDASTKQCVDKDGVQVGACRGEVTRPGAVCKSSATCGDSGSCVGGICQNKAACSTTVKCEAGETCTGGFCFAALRKYVPRAEMTENEKLHSRTEWQYSTVMDYGQKINSDLHSLGKYDYAAIKFGYGEMVEVYADTSYLEERTRKYAETQKTSFEAVSWKMNTERWKYTGDLTPTFEILNHWMPQEFNKKRETVPGFLVTLEDQNVVKFKRNDADRTFFEVPYKYHSDEFRGAQGVYTFDTGASPEEIVHHAGVAMTEYYLMDAFKRERLWFGKGGNVASYISRVTDRWLVPMGNAGRFYAIYNNYYRVYPWFNYFEHTAFGMNSLRRASQDAFNRLAALISTPAPGAHKLDTVSGAYVSDSYEDKPGAVNVPMGQGKYPWTTFATKQGYYYYDHPLWIGGYWDKAAAIGILTSSTADFLGTSVGKGEKEAGFRGTAIGFNTIYPKQLASLLGGLAAGDIGEIGGTFDKKTGKYTPRDFFQPPSNTAIRVAPSIINQSLRLLGAWQAIANLPAGFDPEFTDSMALWLKGNGSQFEIGSTTIGSNGVKIEQVEFDDPFGKKTYVAIKPNYDADRYSPTFRMLQRLNLLKTGCSGGEDCGATGVCKTGTQCTKTWYTKATGAEKDAIGLAIKKEIDTLDLFRMLYDKYGNIR